MTSCRAEALQAPEALAATAPYALGWIIVEVPGSWGRNAVTDSQLNVDVATALVSRAQGTGTTVLVARRPGRSDEPQSRRVWLAHAAPGGVRMRVLEIHDDRELLSLDPAGIAAGNSPGIGEKSSEPTLFVCANAKRDQCCAIEGGPLVRALSDSLLGDRIWECSHLGGHRFAATALLLPWGLVHGRLTRASVESIMHSASRGELDLDSYRGRTALPRWLQAAEIAVRREYSILGIEALDVLRVVRGVAVPGGGPEPTESIDTEVRATDGRAWRVTVTRDQWTSPRIESCTGEPVSGVTWTPTPPIPTDSWA